MEHFARVIFEKNDKLTESIDETIFPDHELLETDQGESALHIPLPRALSEAESDEFAEKLSNYMFDLGLEDFDIEITAADL